jgi:hypothetical protein
MEWVESPSKFEKRDDMPAALRLDNGRFRAGSCGGGDFKDDPHTSWENFQKTMMSPQHKVIVNRDMYPKRFETHDLKGWEQSTTDLAIRTRNKSFCLLHKTAQR